MDSNTVIMRLTRNQATYLKFFVRLLLIITGAVIAPAAYADTIELKPDLPAARLAQIEAQMAPAKLFTVRPFNQSFPTIRGRIIAVEPSPDHSQWVLKVRAWWRAVPNERVKWSSGLVALPRDVVRSIALEFDSLFGLRFALSDRDMTSEVWLKRMLQAFDPDGRLGLAPEGSTPESAREAASVKLESGLLKSLRANVRNLTPVEVQSEDKKLANPLYWMLQNWSGLLTQSILYAIAFDEAQEGGIEPDYRASAEKALAFLSYLTGANVREEFIFGKTDLDDPSKSEVPESERYALGVQGKGYSTYFEIFEAMRLGLMEEGEIMTGGAGTPAAAQIGIEPSEVAFAALKIIEGVPALWLLQSDNEEHRRTIAAQFIDAISELGAPAWGDYPVLPTARRSDKLQFGAAGKAQDFAPKPGKWSLLQAQARKTAITLLLPNYDDPFIRSMKARDQLRASADVYQKVFCDRTLGGPSSDEGIAIAQFGERILIETKHKGRQLSISCLGDLMSTVTGAHTADPTAEVYAQRRRRVIPTLLIIGALFSGPEAVFAGTDLGKEFLKRMSVILDGIKNGQANPAELGFMSHVCAVGGYVSASLKDWDDVAARDALNQAIKAVRTIISNPDNNGDAAQLKVRELVENKTPRVLPLPR